MPRRAAPAVASAGLSGTAAALGGHLGQVTMAAEGGRNQPRRAICLPVCGKSCVPGYRRVRAGDSPQDCSSPLPCSRCGQAQRGSLRARGPRDGGTDGDETLSGRAGPAAPVSRGEQCLMFPAGSETGRRQRELADESQAARAPACHFQVSQTPLPAPPGAAPQSPGAGVGGSLPSHSLAALRFQLLDRMGSSRQGCS